MVTKSKKPTQGGATGKRDKVKVGKLKLNKETVKDLSDKQARGVKGGRATPPPDTYCCGPGASD